MHYLEFNRKLEGSEYLKFIDSIRTMDTPGVYEIHHIYLKSFEDGKVDLPENLIKLSSADHLRAHILLVESFEDLGILGEEYNCSCRAVDWMFKTKWNTLSKEEKEMLCENIPNIAAVREKSVHARRTRKSTLKSIETKRKTGKFIVSEETRKKMSEAHKGVRCSPEHARKISESNKGRKAWNEGKKTPEEVKEKIRASLKGRKRSLEECQKIRDGWKRRHENMSFSV